MAKLPAIFGDHKRAVRGDREEHFSELEWQCVRYTWRATGQRGGPVQYFFLTESGSIDGEAVEMLREIVAAAPSRFAQPLSHELTLSPAGNAILDAAKKAGLTWIRSYDSGDVLFRGTTRVGPLEEATERVPRLADLPPVRSALAKLQALLEGMGPLLFGPVVSGGG